jgi:predicted amidohydrolase
LAKFERYARKAAAQGAQVIIAPKGYLEGYVGNDKRTPDLGQDGFVAEAAEDLNGPLLNRVRALAKEVRVYLMIGFAEKRDGKVFNTAVMFSPAGAVASHYSKSHTMNDAPVHTKGTTFPVTKTKHGQGRTLICFDRQP